jgi:hypothetical protein
MHLTHNKLMSVSVSMDTYTQPRQRSGRGSLSLRVLDGEGDAGSRARHGSLTHRDHVTSSRQNTNTSKHEDGSLTLRENSWQPPDFKPEVSFSEELPFVCMYVWRRSYDEFLCFLTANILWHVAT